MQVNSSSAKSSHWNNTATICQQKFYGEKKKSSILTEPGFSMARLHRDSSRTSHSKAPRLNSKLAPSIPTPFLLWHSNCFLFMLLILQGSSSLSKDALYKSCNPYFSLNLFGSIIMTKYGMFLFKLCSKYPYVKGLADWLCCSFDHNKNMFKHMHFIWSISSALRMGQSWLNIQAEGKEAGEQSYKNKSGGVGW